MPSTIDDALSRVGQSLAAAYGRAAPPEHLQQHQLVCEPTLQGVRGKAAGVDEGHGGVNTAWR
jgi:hypothetical protein